MESIRFIVLNMLRGISVQEGSSGIRFDHDQFEIHTFPIYARPNIYIQGSVSRKLTLIEIQTTIE